MSADPLIPVFMPPLVALLAHEERAKGSPLTREEVLAIRDRGVCIMLWQSMASEIAAKRGYEDIDPETAWDQWQVVRAELPENEGPA